MAVLSSDIAKLGRKAGVQISLDELATHASLREAGLDSMDMMNLFLEIEDAYRLKIPDEDYALLDSVDAIVVYLDAHLQ